MPVITNPTQDTSKYSWNFGDGFISNETNPTHAYATTDKYNVTLLNFKI